MANEDKTLGTKENPIGKNFKIDPEEERRAIEIEENYKKIHGHYPKGSVYIKAIEEREKEQEERNRKNGGAYRKTRTEVVDRKPAGRIPTPALEPLTKSPWVGVRKNLNGEIIGDYNMHNTTREQ